MPTPQPAETNLSALTEILRESPDACIPGKEEVLAAHLLRRGVWSLDALRAEAEARGMTLTAVGLRRLTGEAA